VVRSGATQQAMFHLCRVREKRALGSGELFVGVVVAREQMAVGVHRHR